jgi:hypothetical protein
MHATRHITYELVLELQNTPSVSGDRRAHVIVGGIVVTQLYSGLTSEAKAKFLTARTDVA